jgi:hypothetical protein
MAIPVRMVLIWLKKSNNLSNIDVFSNDFPADISNTLTVDVASKIVTGIPS